MSDASLQNKDRSTQTGASSVRPWLAVGTLWQRELVRFFRQRNRVFSALGQPIIFWLLLSAGLESKELDYLHFFPGILVMILLFTAIFATISIIEDRREGFLQTVLIAPMPRWSMTLGMVSGGATLALLQAIAFLALGYFTLDGLSSNPADIAVVVIFMAIISVALTSLGFLIAWQMQSTHGFHAIMMLLLMPMWLLSGAFFPPGNNWLAMVVKANPLTYGVEGLRQLLTETSSSQPLMSSSPSLALCWAVTCLFAAVAFSLAWYVSRRSTKGDLL